VLVCDAHPTQKKREVRDYLTQIGTTLRILEANTQWANRAELYIGLLKEATRKDLRETNSPMVLWDYCMERRAKIYQITAKNLFQLNGTNPHTATFGTEADISTHMPVCLVRMGIFSRPGGILSISERVSWTMPWTSQE
jgi:hypothetical protein